MAGCCHSRRVYVPSWDMQERAVCLCWARGCAGHPLGLLLSALIKVGLSTLETADKCRGDRRVMGSAHSHLCVCLYGRSFSCYCLFCVSDHFVFVRDRPKYCPGLSCMTAKTFLWYISYASVKKPTSIFYLFCGHGTVKNTFSMKLHISPKWLHLL